MAEYCCSISVENAREDEVKKMINEQLGDIGFGSISIEVEDRSEIYAYTAQFMKEQGLEEPDPILKVLDLTNFTIDIDICCTENSFGLTILDIVADAIGYTVSKNMNTRTLVTLTNQKTPFCMFNRGHREQVFLEENKQHFARRFWKPADM